MLVILETKPFVDQLFTVISDKSYVQQPTPTAAAQAPEQPASTVHVKAEPRVPSTAARKRSPAKLKAKTKSPDVVCAFHVHFTVRSV